jgi:hypothetical protein
MKPAVREKPVVEHAVLEFPLVDPQAEYQCHAYEECGYHVRIRPCVWVLRVGEADAEQDESRCKERVAHPVEPGKLFTICEAHLGLLYRRVV